VTLDGYVETGDFDLSNKARLPLLNGHVPLVRMKSIELLAPKSAPVNPPRVQNHPDRRTLMGA
jgi:hypothetical protein